MKKTFRAGGFMAGQTFTIDETTLNYVSVYGKRFSVPTSQIETVTVDTSGAGWGLLKIIGRGTVLASLKLAYFTAVKTQKWILENIESK